MKDNILISMCLIGINCKYNAGNNYRKNLCDLSIKYNLIPFCPEQMGGLSTPRDPSEIKGERVITCRGEDVTNNFKAGAEESLKLARFYSPKFIILKDGSPSCGVSEIYDGTFEGRKIIGSGTTTKLLKENGFKLKSEKDYNSIKTKE